MFKIKHLEGGKFQLGRERGSSLEKECSKSSKHSTKKSSVRNIRDKFEKNTFHDYTHPKTFSKSLNILFTLTKRGRGIVDFYCYEADL